MKPTCFFLENWSFDELELIIETSNPTGKENDMIDMIILLIDMMIMIEDSNQHPTV